LGFETGRNERHPRHPPPLAEAVEFLAPIGKPFKAVRTAQDWPAAPQPTQLNKPMESGSGTQPRRRRDFRSTDHGATWTNQEITIAPFPRGIVRDPDDGAHRTGDINPEAAVDANTGAIYRRDELLPVLRKVQLRRPREHLHPQGRLSRRQRQRRAPCHGALLLLASPEGASIGRLRKHKRAGFSNGRGRDRTSDSRM
jgi:hypothetical protein